MSHHEGYSHVVCFDSPVFRFRSPHFAPSSSTRMSGARACDRLHNTLRHCALHSTYSTGSLVCPLVEKKPLSSMFRNCCACSNCFKSLSHKTVLLNSDREREPLLLLRCCPLAAVPLPRAMCSAWSAYDANPLPKTANKKTVHDGTHRSVQGFYVGSWPSPSSNNFSN